MNVTLLGALLLTASLISTVIYMSAIGQLIAGPRRAGLLRTAWCRLIAALMYVGVGLVTLETHTSGPKIGLAVYTFAQMIWWVNARADVRLARRSKGEHVTDPHIDPTASSPLAPQYSPPLRNEVISLEIDRLSTVVTTLKKQVDDLQASSTTLRSAQNAATGALVFSIIMALVGLVFGLVVYNRADSAINLSQQNAQILAQLKTTQDRLAASVHEQCTLYAEFISFYSARAKAASPQGPAAYDDAFRRLLASADHLQCGLSAPKDLPPAGP
jgi:hypothetical protein